jgi:hypothetical protein
MALILLSTTAVASSASIALALPGITLKAEQAVIETMRISVDEGRPLAKAVQILELKSGTPISYEDPPWIYSDDVVRAADTPEGAEILKTHPNFSAIVPIGGRLDVSLPVDQITGRLTLSPADSLQRLLKDHIDRNNPGTFRIETLERGFVVVPVSARDTMGQIVPVRSPLDFPIFFSETERTGVETLQTLLDTASKSSGYRVAIGAIPNHLMNTRATFGARGETGRDLLIKFNKTHQWSDPRNRGIIPQMPWRLLFDPKEKTYYLNLLPVRREELDPSGRKLPVTVPR